MKSKIIVLALFASLLLRSEPASAKLQKKQVNMGIVNPYEAKEKKSDFRPADSDKAKLNNLKQEQNNSKEKFQEL